jgi:Tfp pilus assembly protein PilN
MRAVNLLPEKHRPRKRTGGGGDSRSTYFVLGGLAALLLAVFVYVLTLNSINGAKGDIAQAKTDAQRANAQAQSLGAYGDFAKVKQQREQAVEQIASQRMDWERLVRELAHVLPSGVWIDSAAAADSAADAQGSSEGGAPAADSSDGNGPTLTLEGCATSQARVADAIVRLRQLQGATDVKLDHSSRPGDSATPSGSSSSGSTGDCGTIHGTPNYSFQADVTLSKPSASSDEPGTTPASLGGGQ